MICSFNLCQQDQVVLRTFKLTISLVKWIWGLLIFITILESKNTVYLLFLSFLRPTQKKTKSWENHYQMIIMIDWNGFDGKTCNCNNDLNWVLLWRKVYHSYVYFLTDKTFLKIFVCFCTHIKHVLQTILLAEKSSIFHFLFYKSAEVLNICVKYVFEYWHSSIFKHSHSIQGNQSVALRPPWVDVVMQKNTRLNQCCVKKKTFVIEWRQRI